MNAVDVLKYGHATVLQTIDGLPYTAWEQPGVTGIWSVKHVIAHLASFECVLLNLLTEFADGDPHTFRSPMDDAFNMREVERRAHLSPEETLHELNAAHTSVMALAQDIAPETWRATGTLPWYGLQYSLDDLVVYMYYGHKREHSAQIALFVERLKRERINVERNVSGSVEQS